MERFEKFETSFLQRNSSTYHLLVMLNSKYPYFVILDNSKKALLGIVRTNYTHSSFIDLIPVLKNELLLNQEWGSMSFVFPGNKAVLVPKDVYVAGNGEDFYSLLFEKEIDETLTKETLSNPNSELLYTLPIGLDDAIKFAFPNSDFLNIQGLWLNQIHSFCQTHPDGVFVLVGNNTVSISVFKKSELKLYNHYEVFSDQDILYFILLVLQTENIRPHSVNCYIQLGYLPSLTLIGVLKQYIKEVNYFLPNLPIKFNHILNSKELIENQFIINCIS